MLKINPDKIKIICWCLYKRTKAKTNSSYPRHVWYDQLLEKYTQNMIDIDYFTNKFNQIIIDDGGHPNTDGYSVLAYMNKSFKL